MEGSSGKDFKGLRLLPVLGGCDVFYYSRETAHSSSEVLLVYGSTCERRKAETIHRCGLLDYLVGFLGYPVRVHYKADFTSI
jgi:hypothetical protein